MIKNNMLNITFSDNKETKLFILDILDKATDEDGYIIEKGTQNRVIDADGQFLTLSEFGGVKNGSEIFFKDDIVSLVSFYQKYLVK